MGRKKLPGGSTLRGENTGAAPGERCGREVRHTHKTRDGQFLWTYASVKNILVEEACTGVLNNHRREYNNGKAKHIDKTDWYRHEGFFPVIIEKQEWGAGTGVTQAAGTTCKRQSGQAPLCGTADLP